MFRIHFFYSSKKYNFDFIDPCNWKTVDLYETLRLYRFVFFINIFITLYIHVFWKTLDWRVVIRVQK